jgi:hypothetical protein
MIYFLQFSIDALDVFMVILFTFCKHTLNSDFIFGFGLKIKILGI